MLCGWPCFVTAVERDGLFDTLAEKPSQRQLLGTVLRQSLEVESLLRDLLRLLKCAAAFLLLVLAARLCLVSEVMCEVFVWLHLVEKLRAVKTDLRSTAHRVVTHCVLFVLNETQLLKSVNLDDLLLLNSSHLLRLGRCVHQVGGLRCRD